MAWNRCGLVVGLVLALGAAGPACGDSAPSLPDPGPSSGLDPSSRIPDLTDAQAGALCDWIAGRFGGYGQGVTCADGTTLSARQSRELCMMDFQSTSSSCTATVSDLQDCTNGAVAQPRCATVPAVCFVILTCMP
jgi:hypothetical protein